MRTFAESTFLGWSAGEWEAVGVWVTAVITVLLVLFAWWQILVARDVRLDQARPYVVVDVEFRNLLVLLDIKNSGLTAATDVRVTFDEPMASSLDGAWENPDAFREGLPFMAPGRKIEFLFDSYIERAQRDLPMTIRGVVTYGGTIADRRQPYVDHFVIDLKSFEGSQLPENGLHELVNELKSIRKEMTKWKDGNRGIRVTIADPPSSDQSSDHG